MSRSRKHPRLRAFLTDAWIVLRRAVAKAREDDVTLVAQALAYSLFLAIPAAMLVALGVFSIFADASTVESLIVRAQTVLPAEAATLLRDSLRRSTESPSSGIVMTVLGLALAVWTTTSAAVTLMRGITVAFGGEESRGFVRTRLVAGVIVAALLLAAALVVGLLVLGPHLEAWIGDALGAPTLTAWVWWTLQWPVLVAGLLFAFAVVLSVGPDVDRAALGVVSPGAAAALVVWLGASAGLAFYSANFGSYDKTWGTLAAVVVTLVWLWLTSAAVLFGAEVNAAVRQLSAERTTTR